MRNEATMERIGSALRALAEDLVSERRRVLLLRRENRRLREELAHLGVIAEAPGDLVAEVGSEDRSIGRLAVCPRCGQTVPEAPRQLA